MRVSIINASILVPFRTFVDMELIVPRSIIARFVPVNLAAQVIRILDVRRSNIARLTLNAQLVQCAMEVYAQVNQDYIIVCKDNVKIIKLIFITTGYVYILYAIRSALWKYERLHWRSTLHQWHLPTYLQKQF